MGPEKSTDIIPPNDTKSARDQLYNPVNSFTVTVYSNTGREKKIYECISSLFWTAAQSGDGKVATEIKVSIKLAGWCRRPSIRVDNFGYVGGCLKTASWCRERPLGFIYCRIVITSDWTYFMLSRLYKPPKGTGLLIQFSVLIVGCRGICRKTRLVHS